MQISAIKVPRHRVRHELGDIDSLATSMSELGLLQPVVVDADGVLVAGVRRLEAAKKLGWTDIKTTTVRNLDDTLKRLKAERDENTCRLNFLVEEAVDMAERIWPMENKAAEAREKAGRPSVESTEGETRDKVAQSVGMGWQKLARATEVVHSARAEPEKYQPALDLMNKTGKVSRAYAMVRREKKRKATLAAIVKTTDDNYRVFLGDIRKHKDFDIQPDSVDIIITDPPYPEEYIELYTPLAELAERVLKPGGLCVVMTAHYTLPETMRRLGEHLSYWWISAYLMPRNEGRVFSRKALVGWKPLLVYSKGDYTGEWFKDVCNSVAPSKCEHEWGQDEAGMASILDSFTQPGMTVLDPFCGGGSTGAACLKLGCKFIGADNDQVNVNLTSQRLEALNGNHGH